jgi:hypothetical protein
MQVRPSTRLLAIGILLIAKGNYSGPESLTALRPASP